MATKTRVLIKLIMFCCILVLQVRLVGVDNVHGRLEVFRKGLWGTVCDDVFDEAAARVVCNMLGHGYLRSKQS